MKDTAFATRLFFGLLILSYVILYGLMALIS
jgi:hypothetical protein